MSTSDTEEASMVCNDCSTELWNVLVEVNEVLGLFSVDYIVKVNVFVAPFEVVDDSSICEFLFHNKRLWKNSIMCSSMSIWLNSAIIVDFWFFRFVSYSIMRAYLSSRMFRISSKVFQILSPLSFSIALIFSFNGSFSCISCKSFACISLIWK